MPTKAGKPRSIILLRHHNRQNSNQRGNDLIDLMIDAMEDELCGEDEQDDDGQFEKDSKLNHTNRKKSREFDITTLAATALVLLFAGYDTTGITLGRAPHMTSSKFFYSLYPLPPDSHNLSSFCLLLGYPSTRVRMSYMETT